MSFMDEQSAPPVQLPPKQSESSLAPWGMVAFWSVIFALVTLQMFSYLGSGKDGAEDAGVRESELQVKMYLAGEAFQSSVDRTQKPTAEMLEMRTDARKKQISSIADGIRDGGVKGVEESRYLVLSQRAGGYDLDKGAVKILEGSKDPIDQTILAAARGDGSAAGGLDANSDDLAVRWARGLALEAGGEKGAEAKVFSATEAMGVFLPFFGLVALIGAGVIVLVGYFVYRGTGGLKAAAGWPLVWSHDQAEANMMRAGAFLFLYFVVAQGLIPLGAMAVAKSMGMKLEEAGVAVIAQVVGVVFLFGLAAFPVGGTKANLLEMVRGQGRMGSHVVAGFLAYLANFPIFTVAAVVGNLLLGKVLPTPTHVVSEELAGSPSFFTVVVLGLVAAVFAPFIEEVIFRGWFFGGVNRRTGNVAVSIFLAGLSFAMIHPQGPILWGALGCIGAMGAFVTYRTGSLVPAMVMHGLHNFTILLIGSSMLG